MTLAEALYGRDKQEVDQALEGFCVEELQAAAREVMAMCRATEARLRGAIQRGNDSNDGLEGTLRRISQVG